MEEARLRQIEPVEQAIAAACPQAVFYRAYTSPHYSPDSGGAGDDGSGPGGGTGTDGGGRHHPWWVQPTHLLYGYEYDRIRQTVEKWAAPV